MKIKLLVILSLLCTLLLCACGELPEPITPNKDSEISTEITDETFTQIIDKKVETFPSQTLAAECLESAVNAASAEELAPQLTAATQEELLTLLSHYNGTGYQAQVEYVASSGKYDIFSYCLEAPGEGGDCESNYCLLYRGENGYQLCIQKDTQNEIFSKFVCALCAGAGSVQIGNPIACGICGGTGWQYIPNAYYDAGLNMWMGQHIGCGGCGGSGWTGNYATAPCGGCGGNGYDFS